MKTRFIWIPAVLLLGFLLGGVTYYFLSKSTTPQYAQFAPRVPKHIEDTGTAFSEIVRAVSPAVVNISSTKTVRRQPTPFDDFFDFFYPYINRESPLFLPFYFLANIGNLGVDLFFVISDYLIYGILLRRDQTWVRFWRRRLVRIYPVFIVAFVVYVGLSLVLPGFDKIGRLQNELEM